uniref:Uncharacterized protein n=1 Tax=Quercus lobata TaxID=97700 RepID=A0A7N2MV22_QUELO
MFIVIVYDMPSIFCASSNYGISSMLTKEHKLVHPPKLPKTYKTESQKAYKILLAFSGLKQALTTNPGYNRRVAECQEAARIILNASGNNKMEPILSNGNSTRIL